MRISDWSSDVCSSDLAGEILAELVGRALQAAEEAIAPACAGFSHCCASCAISAPFSRPVMVAWMMEEGVCGAPKRTGAKFSARSEEHTSELQSLMRISYAVFCLKKKKQTKLKRPNQRLNTLDITLINIVEVQK